MRKELWKTKRRRQLRLVHLVDGEREAEVVVVVGGAVASRWARISRGSGHREQRCDADGDEHVGQSSGGHGTVPRFEQKEFLTVLPPRAAAFFLYASLATRRTRAVARRLDGHSDGHFSTGTSRLADRDCSRSHPCRAWRGCACQPSLLGWLRYYSHWFMHTPTSLGSPFAVHTDTILHPFIVFIHHTHTHWSVPVPGPVYSKLFTRVAAGGAHAGGVARRPPRRRRAACVQGARTRHR